MKFTRKQKQMAKVNTREELKRVYESTEKALKLAARRKDKKGLNRTMKVHQDVEYALLLKEME